MIYYGKSPDVKNEKALESDKRGFTSQFVPFLAWWPHRSYSAAQVAHKMEITTHAWTHHFTYLTRGEIL